MCIFIFYQYMIIQKSIVVYNQLFGVLLQNHNSNKKNMCVLCWFIFKKEMEKISRYQ